MVPFTPEAALALGRESQPAQGVFEQPRVFHARQNNALRA